MAVMKDPEAFFHTLEQKYNYKLKGVGPPKYHLGGDFYRDPDGTLAWGAQSYIQRMLKNYKCMFGEVPKPSLSPLDHNDSPELDTSPELDAIGADLNFDRRLDELDAWDSDNDIDKEVMPDEFVEWDSGSDIMKEEMPEEFLDSSEVDTDVTAIE